MIKLRGVEPGDLEALYHICLVTGDASKDATALHADPKLLGHLYVAPYAVLEPEHALVAEDEHGVVGYLVGTYDTDAFLARQEQEWWPALRRQYADMAGLTAADRASVSQIMSPGGTPADLVAAYPAHIHMNLLERARGQKVGTRLLTRWLDEARASGVNGVHLGASAANTGGIAFWTHSGFVPDRTVGRTVWFHMDL